MNYGESKYKEFYFKRNGIELIHENCPTFTYYNKYWNDKKHTYYPDFYDNDKNLIIEVKSLPYLVGPNWDFYDNNKFKFLSVLLSGYNLILYMSDLELELTLTVDNIDEVLDNLVKDYNYNNQWISNNQYYYYVNPNTGELLTTYSKINDSNLVERGTGSDHSYYYSMTDHKFFQAPKNFIYNKDVIKQAGNWTNETVWVTNGKVFKRIKSSELELLSKEWRIESPQKGRISITNGIIYKYIKPNELYKYRDWKRESPQVGLVTIYNKNEYKKVDSTKLESYLEQGWIKEHPNKKMSHFRNFKTGEYRFSIITPELTYPDWYLSSNRTKYVLVLSNDLVKVKIPYTLKDNELFVDKNFIYNLQGELVECYYNKEGKLVVINNKGCN